MRLIYLILEKISCLSELQQEACISTYTSLEAVSHIEGTTEARLICHAGMYEHISQYTLAHTCIHTHTHKHLDFLFPFFQSTVHPLWTLFRHYSVSLKASCWPKPHSCSSWISCTAVVFIVPFFPDSWVSCMVKAPLQFSLLRMSLSAGVCICACSVCVWVQSLKMCRCVVLIVNAAS